MASLIDLGLCPPGEESGSFMTLPNLIAPDGASQVPTGDFSLLLGGPVAPLVSATVFGSTATV